VLKLASYTLSLLWFHILIIKPREIGICILDLREWIITFRRNAYRTMLVIVYFYQVNLQLRRKACHDLTKRSWQPWP
jgi:hypothetical protein